MYIGTYTGPKSQGIYRATLDLQTGALSEPELAGKTDNPSFLALHSSGRFLYAVNEGGNGAVSSFAIDKATGNLTLINRQPSHGSYPAHLSLDPTGRCLMVANYGNGAFASYPLAADGSIGAAASILTDTGTGPNKGRQEGPHAHGIWPWPGRQIAVGCDLGNDRLDFFATDAATASLKRLGSYALAPGTGPRHLIFAKNGLMYIIAELNNTISVMAPSEPDAAGVNPRLVQTISTLPPDFSGQSKAAELEMHPSGKFLYATNRGADDLVTFSVEPRTGKLAEVARTPTGGRGPRDFVIDPTGKWLLVANQDSNDITVFALDPATGKPSPVGKPVRLQSPVCILFQTP